MHNIMITGLTTKMNCDEITKDLKKKLQNILTNS